MNYFDEHLSSCYQQPIKNSYVITQYFNDGGNITQDNPHNDGVSHHKANKMEGTGYSNVQSVNFIKSSESAEKQKLFIKNKKLFFTPTEKQTYRRISRC